ncbi:hypothetical protein Avbf_12676 [Armadillidium vulgare]|nr:hypothetical protein Avbf_12676 [Armadillidium vulgare]
MRTQIVKIFRGNEMRIFGSRFVTTTSHPRHATDISARAKEETQESGEIMYSPFPDLKIPNKDIFSYFYDISKSWQHKTLQYQEVK